uniref:Uncharacterized protein n=1 Tax=Oryza sativa subsp. japonica TaxID=39947 RepID=Q8L3Z9_ORYSJ|nr:hypothetical protein [Oryza sativa Japonica Group]BAD30736.1 hypothetical protein [Oryza sativa Japonica Group]
MSAITTELLVLDDAAAGASKAAPGTGEARAAPDPRHHRRPPRSTSSSPPREEGPDASAGGTSFTLKTIQIYFQRPKVQAFMVWPYDPRAILMLEKRQLPVDRVDSHAGREEELLPRRIAARRALADDTDSINQYDQQRGQFFLHKGLMKREIFYKTQHMEREKSKQQKIEKRAKTCIPYCLLPPNTRTSQFTCRPIEESQEKKQEIGKEHCAEPRNRLRQSAGIELYLTKSQELSHYKESRNADMPRTQIRLGGRRRRGSAARWFATGGRSRGGRRGYIRGGRALAVRPSGHHDVDADRAELRLILLGIPDHQRANPTHHRRLLLRSANTLERNTLKKKPKEAVTTEEKVTEPGEKQLSPNPPNRVTSNRESGTTKGKKRLPGGEQHTPTPKVQQQRMKTAHPQDGLTSTDSGTEDDKQQRPPARASHQRRGDNTNPKRTRKTQKSQQGKSTCTYPA